MPEWLWVGLGCVPIVWVGAVDF